MGNRQEESVPIFICVEFRKVPKVIITSESAIPELVLDVPNEEYVADGHDEEGA